MTKASPILFCPVDPLRQLPPAEVEVIRRFLFEHIRGMDRKHDKRWRRLWGRVWQAEPGEGFQVYSAEERSGPFHRRHRAILEQLFQGQERFRTIKGLHDWMKVGGGWVIWKPGKDNKPVAIPRTTSFPETSEDEMREAHAAMVDFLHTDRAQRFLWRHLPYAKRQEMLDTLLANPKDRDQ